jgi:dihydroorotate dehydrogenase
VFSQTGVRAVVATNTLGQPAPDNPKLQAGMSGKSLFPHALRTARVLNEARFAAHAHLDIVACGGIVDGKSYLAYKSLGINVAQCWSAFIYRGPLALQLIESEAHD